jgi:hypothetical protein
MKWKFIFILIVFSLLMGGCIQSIANAPSSTGHPPTPTSEFRTLEEIGTMAAQVAMTQTSVALGTADPVELTAVSATNTAVYLRVILPDGLHSDFTSQSIESLATLSLSLFDQLRPAVDLRRLLEQAGWHRYPLYSVTIEGVGSLTLQVDHLPEDAALYLDNGMLNFVSGKISVDDWPRDVVLIVIR